MILWNEGVAFFKFNKTVKFRQTVINSTTEPFVQALVKSWLRCIGFHSGAQLDFNARTIKEAADGK